ncbi:DUF4956 domain-containing protein [Microbacterium sp. H1-D42]|uniref:DUF4956 domain-containing protein n=1 Tax=Microbacterium sp. H1-D42 TaxID=2925844 RepID=UPI001F52B83C|nr:DUF4956 domain-containing protein [Microbacterium sp. H1-D42]UNK72191.1 DUF4956 domain-containing protein [Microbacterium sp. H1-D42]
MSLAIAIITDLVAITLLAYVLYFRRHRRRDLLLSYIALNIGVFAVTVALSSVEVGIGLGIGLFGILSIIRLRSDQITQQEIAYYFVSLVLGLLTGLRPTPVWAAPALAAVIVLAMFIVDSRWTARRSRRRTVTLDRAYLDEVELEQVLRDTFNATSVRFEVLELDLVREITVVDARYQVARSARPAAADPIAVQQAVPARVVSTAPAPFPSGAGVSAQHAEANPAAARPHVSV